MDVRSVGSGNTGAANVGRTFGFRLGLAVAVGDIAKGLVAALVGAQLGGPGVGVAAGVAAVCGHWRPVFLGFRRGGKIVATTGGVVLALVPLAALAAAGVWVVTFLVTRYSSAASLAAAAALPALVFGFGGGRPALAFTVGAAAGIVFLHRANIARLARGEENRFSFSLRRAAVAGRGLAARYALRGSGPDT